MHYAIVFFVIAAVAAVFGFGDVSPGAEGIGKVMFFVFAIMSVIGFLYGLIRNAPPSDIIFTPSNPNSKESL